MKLKILYTDRYFNNWPTWPLIYEWEDIIAEALGLKLVDSGRASVITLIVDKVLRFTSRNLFGSNKLLILADKLVRKKEAFYFDLLVRGSFYFTGSRNTLPVIIDFSKSIDLETFYNAYKNCRAVLISNKQAYNYLKFKKCPLKIYHFPQSISDKYEIQPDTTFKKKFDIIIPGRTDSVLWSYLQEYEKIYPDVEFLYRENINGTFFYISNKTKVAYRGQEREEYMHLLQSSKVAFYSTVGIDGDQGRTGGFSPVTPRFLEMISAGCQILARYPQNAETDFFEMNKICLSCDNYSIFENDLNKALNNDGPDMKIYSDYLTKHYTSERVKLLSRILNEI